MGNVLLTATVREDGTLTIPAFAVRGLGYAPEDTIRLTMPDDGTDCGIECYGELFLGHCCPDAMCNGYTTNLGSVNLPQRLFTLAGVPSGAEVTLTAGDGALVLAAGTGACADLPEAIGELLEDLGIDPEVSLPLGTEF